MDFLIEPKDLQDEARQGEVLIVDCAQALRLREGPYPGRGQLQHLQDSSRPTRGPAGLAAFARDVAMRYANAGISANRAIVVYDDDTGMCAARDAWILQYLGHSRRADTPRRARGVARGGLQPERGGGRTNGPSRMRVRERAGAGDRLRGDRGPPGPPRASRCSTCATPTSTRGATSTACCTRRGHIPGLGVDRVDAVSRGRALQAGRRRYCGLLRESGVEPGIGNRARTATAARARRTPTTRSKLRRPDQVRNYIGSWHEWSARSELPIEKGEG